MIDREKVLKQVDITQKDIILELIDMIANLQERITILENDCCKNNTDKDCGCT